MRSFEDTGGHLDDQINQLDEEFEDRNNFIKTVFEDDRHDIERIFRERGKFHKSVIGEVNSGVESMEFVLGGPLHNEIGVGNDCLDLLLKELSDVKLDSICTLIKTYLNTSKATGGAGCTPGHHHGGKYNGTLNLRLNI